MLIIGTKMDMVGERRLNHSDNSNLIGEDWGADKIYLVSSSKSIGIVLTGVVKSLTNLISDACSNMAFILVVRMYYWDC